MAFPESIKLKVKKRAHFQCCICSEFDGEIHHIIPQAENGPDTEDNAAPLCPTCHGRFGDNPKKRKVIRQKRDHWYELCEKREAQPDWDEIKATILESKNNEIEILKNSLKDKDAITLLQNKELQRLQEEKQRLERQIDQVIEEQQHKDLSQTSALYQEAYYPYTAGDIDLALEKLSESKLEQQYQHIQKQRQVTQLAAEQLADTYTLKAQMHRLKFQFTEAEASYEKAMEINPNWNNIRALATYYYNQKQSLKAAPLYQTCFKIARTSEEQAISLNDLGNLQIANNKLSAADVSYKKSLGIRRQLASDNPSVYLPDVAGTLNNLGLLQSTRNEFLPARDSYLESLAIFRQLAKENSTAYLHYVAMTLNNLGNLQSVQNEPSTASASYKESLKIYRQLAKGTPDVYLPHVAISLNNLGVLYRNQNELALANTLYKESLGLYKQLAKDNPSAYLPYVALNLNNLGNLHRDQDNTKIARSSYKESLEIYRGLAQGNPLAYRPYVANVLSNLGTLQIVSGELLEANVSYEESLSIYRPFAKDNPATYTIPLCRTINNLSIFHINNLPDQQKSIQLAQETLALMKDFKHVPEGEKYYLKAEQIIAYWKKEEEE